MPDQLKLKWRAPKGIEKKEKAFFDKNEERVRKALFAKVVQGIVADEVVEVDDKGWVRLLPVCRTEKSPGELGYVSFCLPKIKTGTRPGEIAKRETRNGSEWVKLSTVPALKKAEMVGGRILYL